MFTKPENEFLSEILNLYSKEKHILLKSSQLSLEEKVELEKKLMMCVGIINKLAQNQKASVQSTQPEEVKVLLVDDIESMRNVVKHFLHEAGFEFVDTVSSAPMALKSLKQAFDSKKPYTLVISDWEMPKISGFELLKKVRTDDDLATTPFYLLTSVSDKKSIKVAIDAGVTGYMIKPVNTNVLKVHLKMYLN